MTERLDITLPLSDEQLTRAAELAPDWTLVPTDEDVIRMVLGCAAGDNIYAWTQHS